MQGRARYPFSLIPLRLSVLTVIIYVTSNLSIVLLSSETPQKEDAELPRFSGPVNSFALDSETRQQVADFTATMSKHTTAVEKPTRAPAESQFIPWYQNEKNEF